MDWARMLAYVTGTVDQELLARNEYLAAENRIMKAQFKGRLKLSEAERGAHGEIGYRLGGKVPAEIATVARPDTILGWYRKLIARKFDGSKARRGPGRPRIKREVEQLIIRMARENRPHLRRILAAYAVYYNELRTHLSLGKDAPRHRSVRRLGALRDCRYLLHDRDTKSLAAS
jgi:hypothetical protein